MVLVMGATGTTGSVVVRELLERGAPVRALAHHEDGAQALRSQGAEVVVGDLDDPATLAGAFRGVERAYLATPPYEHQAERERNAISVAEQSGVYHVVKLGLLGQSPQSPVRFAREHADATEALQASSLRWTVLIPAPFMQNFFASAGTILEGELMTSFDEARIAHVDARDVGAVAARALSEEGHENCSYTLTGPEPLTADEIADTLGEVLGRAVRHVKVPDRDVIEALRYLGLDDWRLEGFAEQWEQYRSGAVSAVTADVEALLERPPTPFAKFVADHRPAFGG
jgi:uncharacterized protein YbjT (DUF2867 family)